MPRWPRRWRWRWFTHKPAISAVAVLRSSVSATRSRRSIFERRRPGPRAGTCTSVTTEHRCGRRRGSGHWPRGSRGRPPVYMTSTPDLGNCRGRKSWSRPSGWRPTVLKFPPGSRRTSPRNRSYWPDSPQTAEVWLVDGAPPAPGSVVVLPELAATLREYSRVGPDAIVRGPDRGGGGKGLANSTAAFSPPRISRATDRCGAPGPGGSLRMASGVHAAAVLGRHHPRPDLRDSRAGGVGGIPPFRCRPIPPVGRGVAAGLCRPVPIGRSGRGAGHRDPAVGCGLAGCPRGPDSDWPGHTVEEGPARRAVSRHPSRPRPPTFRWWMATATL